MTERREDIALELARKIHADYLTYGYDDRRSEQFIDSVAALLRPHVREWIPVEERLPQLGLDVLIYSSEWSTGILIDHREECMVSNCRCGIRWMILHDNDYNKPPTHWAALPSAPLSLESKGDTK